MADAVKDSVGAASFAAAELPADVANLITTAANSAFIHALDRTVIVGAVVALLGAFIAFRYLPARSEDTDIERLIEGAAQRLPDDPEQRLGLAHATLGLFADAGMSSLTYNGIAARSGIGTATLERYWGSRVDAVSDALAEVFAAHPVPDTGDLRVDLRAYLLEISQVLSEPRSRQIIGALVSEAASDQSLAVALRERVSEPRRRELESRLQAHESMITVPIDTAIDQLVGPIYYRTVIIHSAIDERPRRRRPRRRAAAERGRDRRHVPVALSTRHVRLTQLSMPVPQTSRTSRPTAGYGGRRLLSAPMKAVVCEAFGPPEALVVVEMDDPTAGDGQLLIEVKASAVTFPDTLMLEDKYQFHPTPPYIPGGEAAGVVVAVGDGVSGWSVGDRVVGGLGTTGGYAELLAIPAATARRSRIRSTSLWPLG